jgi:hypothetical protein
VIDHDGRVTGMAFFHSPNPAIITTSTILICIEMWTQYRSAPFFLLQLEFYEMSMSYYAFTLFFASLLFI